MFSNTKNKEKIILPKIWWMRQVLNIKKFVSFLKFDLFQFWAYHAVELFKSINKDFFYILQKIGWKRFINESLKKCYFCKAGTILTLSAP